MKKILALGLLAIAISAVSHQQASAWVNSRFGIGMNIDWSSGGNSLLWGAWRNAQPGGGDPPLHPWSHKYMYQQNPYFYAPQPVPVAPRSFDGSFDPSFSFQPQPFGVQGYQPMPNMAPGQFANYPIQPGYYYLPTGR